ncbi:hypothetical protein AAHC03_025774 [Spirometra sp. Aus1]
MIGFQGGGRKVGGNDLIAGSTAGPSVLIIIHIILLAIVPIMIEDICRVVVKRSRTFARVPRTKGQKGEGDVKGESESMGLSPGWQTGEEDALRKMSEGGEEADRKSEPPLLPRGESFLRLRERRRF